MNITSWPKAKVCISVRNLQNARSDFFFNSNWIVESFHEVSKLKLILYTWIRPLSDICLRIYLLSEFVSVDDDLSSIFNTMDDETDLGKTLLPWIILSKIDVVVLTGGISWFWSMASLSAEIIERSGSLPHLLISIQYIKIDRNVSPSRKLLWCEKTFFN